jgi:nucleoside-diphosphate-sugar epimerase
MPDVANRTIVLTGATGFLGAFLMAGLLERGYHVTVLGRSSKHMRLADRLSQLLRRFNLGEAEEQLSALEADFFKKYLGLDAETYGSLCEVARKIVLCASNTSFAERNRAQVLAANVDSLHSLLELAADANAEHLCYVSTAYAAGKCEGICMEAPITAASFTNVYEESKAKAERITTRFCAERGVPFSILRPSVVYGHSQTGIALKFNALYYPIKSLLYVRDICIKDILEQGGKRSRQWGISLGADGVLKLPLTIHLAKGGSVNLIPIDYFVETALHIMERPGVGRIYHITSNHPPDMATLVDYSERFLGVQGIRVSSWDPSAPKTASNPAQELLDRLLEQYRPYLSDRRTFDRSCTEELAPGLSAPPFTYDLFERCMAYAVACDWGQENRLP